MSTEAKMKEAMKAAKANAVEAEGVKDVEETTETVDEQKYTVELSKEQYDKVNGYIDLAAKEGAAIYTTTDVKKVKTNAVEHTVLL